MASKFKTPFLKLSKFIGTDKPKMEDFNEDNLIIDNELKKQREKITELNSHSNDRSKHITQSEREKWNSTLWEVGTYVGDGNSTQNIDIGFKPRLGFVFEKDEFLVTATNNASYQIIAEQRAAVLTPLGCNKYCQILDNGFTVCSLSKRGNNYRVPMLNENSHTYVYIMFR